MSKSILFHIDDLIFENEFLIENSQNAANVAIRASQLAIPATMGYTGSFLGGGVAGALGLTSPILIPMAIGGAISLHKALTSPKFYMKRIDALESKIRQYKILGKDTKHLQDQKINLQTKLRDAIHKEQQDQEEDRRKREEYAIRSHMEIQKERQENEQNRLKAQERLKTQHN